MRPDNQIIDLPLPLRLGRVNCYLLSAAGGSEPITPSRKNMEHRLMPLQDKLLRHRRALNEAINDRLSNILGVSHTRHCSIQKFLVNLIAGLISNTHLKKKPCAKRHNIGLRY